MIALYVKDLEINILMRLLSFILLVFKAKQFGFSMFVMTTVLGVPGGVGEVFKG